MQSERFDQWRRDYEVLGVKDHSAFYEELHRDHPDQKHYNAEDAYAFFVMLGEGPVRVCELGGYDGGLAGECLKSFSQIASWTNHDICKVKAKLDDPRYRLTKLQGQMWEQEDASSFDVLVASHVIEHLSGDHLQSLMLWANPLKAIYFDAPLLPTERQSWDGTTAAHKLDLSWSEVSSLMANYGFGHSTIANSARFYWPSL